MLSSVNGTSNSNSTEEIIKICDLESILRESQNDSQLQVIGITASSLVPPGENYSSTMVKIEAKIRRGSREQEVLHLVAKTVKRVEKPFMIWTDVLRKEIFIYSKLIPMYRELEDDVGVAEQDLIDCVPKFMGHRYMIKDESNEVDDHSLLLMENMKVQGYYMGDRKKGLDFEHAIVALTNLARYHALGAVLRQKRPDDFEQVKHEAAILGFIVDEFRTAYDNLLQTFQQEPCFAKNLSKIKASFARMAKDLKKLPEPTEPWVTIIHGDFWTNNLLFHKDDNGKIDSVKFVDFQMYQYTSPCRDVAYFLFGSLDQDLYDRLDELIGLYYKKFIDILRRLGCDTAPFTRKSFDEELKKQLIHGFPTFALCTKYFSYEVSEDEKKDREIAKNVMHSKCSESYKEKLVKIVRIYEERGWL